MKHSLFISLARFLVIIYEKKQNAELLNVMFVAVQVPWKPGQTDPICLI